MSDKTKVLLVGETWFVLKLHVKGFDLVPLGGYENFGKWFVDAQSHCTNLLSKNNRGN